MYYPENMTSQEIMEFEFEYNRLIDIERDEGQYWAVNSELQVISEEIRQHHSKEF